MNNQTNEHPMQFISVCFNHKLPDNEHIGHELYLNVLEQAIRNIYEVASYQPAILTGSVETIMNEIETSYTSLGYTFAFDEIYGDLYSFLEEILFATSNINSLQTLLTYSGCGTIFNVQKSTYSTNIILVVQTHPQKQEFTPH